MERLYREARSAAALDHPNICTIYEINETGDGQLYLVMARYEGETLKERIASGIVGGRGQSTVQRASVESSFTNIRFPEIAGCAHVTVSDTV